MKLLIIGTGRISERFADACKRLGLVPRSVYSRDKARAEAFAKRIGAVFSYDSLDEALEDGDTDAVYVASPNVLHKEHTVAALCRGKHVLCEKALATSYAEYLEMRAAAENSGRLLIEAMRPAFDPVTEVIESAVSEVGKIREARLVFGQYSSRYDAFLSGVVMNAFNPGMKNSALFDIGVYPLYMAVRLFGEPRAISRRSAYLHNGFEGEGVLSLEYPDMTVRVEYSKIRDMKSGGTVVGDRGTVTFDRINAPSCVTLTPTRGTPVSFPTPPHENNMIYEIDSFMKMAEGRLSPLAHINRSDAVMRLLDEVYPYENRS